MKPRRVEAMTVSEYRDWIAGTARGHGWLVRADTEASQAAPNLLLVRAGVVIFALVKSEAARVTDAQDEWLTELAAVPGIQVHTWRPTQMAEVFELLAAEEGVDVEAPGG